MLLTRQCPRFLQWSIYTIEFTVSRVIPLFDYPDDIRRAIYTTNAIESLNSVIRKAINNRRIFPSDRSAFKVIDLAIEQAAKKWTMPIKDWKQALNRFAIQFEGRLPLSLH